MSPLRTLYRTLHRGSLRLLARLGVNVVRTADYYSPLPVLSELERTRERWDRPSELPGLSVDLESMEERLRRIASVHGAELDELPSYDESKGMGYGPGFTRMDSYLIYLVLRDLKPRHYLEVGSGLSTYWAHLALERNRAEGAPCEMAAIDPYARERVGGLAGLEIIRREVQDVEPAFFGRLEAGDVLFIDSTHVVKVDGDVPHLYLEVLPRLAPGVVIHSHDIHFPYNVPHPAQEYVFDAKWPMLWTEAMLLQAFLAFNPAFEIDLSIGLLRHNREAVLAEAMPGYTPLEPGDYDTHAGSLWYRRKG